jgi:hypothetical protein
MMHFVMQPEISTNVPYILHTSFDLSLTNRTLSPLLSQPSSCHPFEFGRGRRAD